MEKQFNKADIKKLIKLFSQKAGGCNVQHNGCPCNTCFHAIDSLDTDFQHIVWLMLLGLRGDYESKEILNAIKEELK